MLSKPARRAGMVAGLALVPAVAFGAVANAATDAPQPPAAQQQAQHPHKGQHKHHGHHIRVNGTITKVETKKVRGHDVRFITVQSKGKDGKQQDRTFAIGKKAKIVDKAGHPVGADQLTQGKQVTVGGVYSAKKHQGIARHIKIDS